MAAHPNKVKWKEFLPHGLSASLFGMALGFKGKVADFIDYELHIVGTNLEFKGNAWTDHGISTEPKSRALYEMLTGDKVWNGGFFLTRDGLLGCSPDGRIFVTETKKNEEGITAVESVSQPDDEDSLDLYQREKRRSKESSSSLTYGVPTASSSPPPVLNASFSYSGRRPQMNEKDRSLPSVSLSWSFKIPFSRSRASSTPLLGTLPTEKECTPVCAPQASVTSSADGREKVECLQSGSTPPCTVSHTLVPLDSPNASQSILSSSPVSPAASFRSGQSSSAMADEFSRVLFWAQQQSIRKRKKKKIKMRLLEIKSPVHQLYGGQGECFQPFGIPLSYMCQMQGQMAIADADECDFFVYVESTGHVEAWRVLRSPAFWEWAQPKLVLICEWLRDGPPSWLDRSFSFEPFDFTLIEVRPLLFPFSIRESVSLAHPKRFPFFYRFACPYSRIKPGTIYPTDTEVEAIAKMVQSEIVRYLFQPKESEAQLTVNETSSEMSFAMKRFYAPDGELFLSALKHAKGTNRSNASVLSSIDEILFRCSHSNDKHASNESKLQGEPSLKERQEQDSHENATLSPDFCGHQKISMLVEVSIADVEDGRIQLCVYHEGKSHEAATFYLHSYHRDVFALLCTATT